jgi:threonine/homoserine/homoserine lactone efflux protein
MVSKFDHISRALDQPPSPDYDHATRPVSLSDHLEDRMIAASSSVESVASLAPVAAVTALVALAAITPGPNNLIILRTAARAGVPATVPAIAGVVLGGLGVLATALAGASLALTAAPRVGPLAVHAASLVGAGYLAWLGRGLIRHAGAAPPRPPATRGLPAASLSGLFAFQFLNPKSWVMVVAAIGARPAGGPASRWPLAVIFAVIPAICLVLWAALGAALSRLLARPRFARWTDRILGGLLVATAIAMIAA